MKLKLCCALVAIIVLAVQGFAEMAGDPRVPVDRLIANTTAYIKEHPQDAMGPYTLARIHYIALVTRASLAWPGNGGRNGLPVVNDPIEWQRSSKKEEAWTEAQLRDHLKLAVENYKAALKMDEKNALFHLGLASRFKSRSGRGLQAGRHSGRCGRRGSERRRFRAPLARAGHHGVPQGL
jgi:hypothetical protein